MLDPRFSVNIAHNDSTARIDQVDAVEHVRSLDPESVDLFVTSPPYCIGKEYESATSTEDFKDEIERSFANIVRAVKPGGSICWQVGSHVTKNVVVPLDFLIYQKSLEFPTLYLRNRIIWTFGHGIHAHRRLSGRHETILWFTKGEDYYFDLDAIRQPQKYPGKRHYKGPKKGQFSGNPNGKNPSDVWEIPNVKANHVEKTNHPCQFPVALIKRLVNSMSPEGGLVCDPYCGTGTSAVAALMAGRNFKGAEIEPRYVQIARERLEAVRDGSARFREDRPVAEPDIGSSVAQRPAHFKLDVADG
jgi:adenine-specific DNA-methyltransferase